MAVFPPIFVFGNHFLQGEIGLFIAVLGKISDVVRKEWMELGNVLHQLLAEKSLGVRVKHSKRLFTILLIRSIAHERAAASTKFAGNCVVIDAFPFSWATHSRAED